MNMRYFWKNQEVWAFDETQTDLITDEMIELTSDELDRHLNPKKYLSDAELQAIKLASMPALTRRQFKLMLHSAGMLEQVERAVAASDDVILKIEYNEATEFLRNNPSVLKMIELLGLDVENVDELWRKATQL